ncbi:MarR family transcriptional regulator [Paenibacillus favisporus]
MNGERRDMEEKQWLLMEEADWHFRRLVRRFVKERDKVSIEGVSLPGMLVLNAILHEGEQKLGDLAERLDFTTGAVTAVCDKLESLGFAQRKRLETDRRSVVLDITDKGRDMLERNRDTGTYMIERIFGGFTAKELEEQIVNFKRLYEHLEGFADAVLKQAHPPENAEEPPPGHRKAAQRPNRFISY